MAQIAAPSDRFETSWIHRMTIPVNVLSANETLDREFLEIRAKILEIAATFDRVQRGSGTVKGDPRVQQIGKALPALLSETPDRAAQVQAIFSLPYNQNWRSEFDI